MAHFQRKNEDIAGSHTIAMKNGDIKLEGRKIYSTDDKSEINILRNDEMVEEVDPKAMIEPKEED